MSLLARSLMDLKLLIPFLKARDVEDRTFLETHLTDLTKSNKESLPASFSGRALSPGSTRYPAGPTSPEMPAEISFSTDAHLLERQPGRQHLQLGSERLGDKAHVVARLEMR